MSSLVVTLAAPDEGPRRHLASCLEKQHVGQKPKQLDMDVLLLMAENARFPIGDRTW